MDDSGYDGDYPMSFSAVSASRHDRRTQPPGKKKADHAAAVWNTRAGHRMCMYFAQYGIVVRVFYIMNTMVQATKGAM